MPSFNEQKLLNAIFRAYYDEKNVHNKKIGVDARHVLKLFDKHDPFPESGPRVTVAWRNRTELWQLMQAASMGTA